MQGEKVAKRSSLGNMVRKGLSDITNSLPRPKSPIIPGKSQPDSATAKDYIDNLVKVLFIYAYIFFCWIMFKIIGSNVIAICRYFFFSDYFCLLYEHRKIWPWWSLFKRKSTYFIFLCLFCVTALGFFPSRFSNNWDS